MTSDGVRNSTTSNTHPDEALILKNIEESFEAKELNHADVCVYRVPKSLIGAKPEAFTPQFVGLGPYHHRRPEMHAIEKLKVAKAKKEFEDFSKFTETLKELSKLAPKIRGNYGSSIAFKDDTLLSLMTLDALFLCELLHSFVSREEGAESADTSILTEIQGMPLVNAAGVEFSKDAIIRDLFMLENQIPTRIFTSIMTKIPSRKSEHGSAMLDFCTLHCPLPPTDRPQAVEHVHLLDLMYHLIVPDPEHQLVPNGVLVHQPETQSEPESHNTQTTCCDIVSVIAYLFLILFVVIGVVLLILELFFSVLRYLFGKLLELVGHCSPVVEKLHDLLSEYRDLPFLKLIAAFVKVVRGTFKFLNESTNVDMDASRAVMIPSVTELHRAGIHFQPAKFGISSIKFDDRKCQFYLPSIRLDANSEVIMRNLVAYESLTKSDYLYFTGYIELLRAIIHTAEDVNLLVEEKIIKTNLSDKVVAQLFNEMSKSIRPTKTPDLDQEIKKVKDKFDSAQKLYRVITKYANFTLTIITVVAALVFLVLSFVQTYCSVYSCSGTSKIGNGPEYGNYGGNNYFISSL